MVQLYRYQVFGLSVASTFILPELTPAHALAPADVTIRCGAVPPALDAPTWRGVCHELDERRCLFQLGQLAGARYLIQEGKEIVVERAPEADAAKVRLFLLGACMAPLLYQRKCLPIHASALQTDQGGVLFAGASGSGKSAVAASLTRRGYPVLADDISAINFDREGVPRVTPGIPNLKLWPDILARLGHKVQDCDRVRPELDKYAAPSAVPPAVRSARIRALYILQPSNGDTIQVEPIHGAEKFPPLWDNIYRRKLALQMGQAAWLFAVVSRLAQHVCVRRITFPHHRFFLDELLQQVEEDWT